MRHRQDIGRTYAARKRERGSVLGWIVILLLLASAGCALLIVFSHSLQDPSPGTFICYVESDPAPVPQELREALETAQDTDGYRRIPLIETQSLRDSIEQDGAQDSSEIKE